MEGSQRVILRFVDGKMLKGLVKELKLTDDYLFIEDESDHQLKVRLKELKAIFFVKTFEGNRAHHEKKTFSNTPPASKRVFIKFKDGETMMGFMEGEIPWQRGFFLESMKDRGFPIIPVDEDSNNIKILIITSAVKDVALIGS